MSLALQCISLDCADNDRVARFWEEALGYRRAGEGGAYVVVRHPEGLGPALFFQRVPEPKAGKNRMHIDVLADDREAEVRRLVALGARRGEDHDELGHRWTIMYDVEGNEFCVEG